MKNTTITDVEEILIFGGETNAQLLLNTGGAMTLV